MPNWCSNTVTISHSDPCKIAALADAMEQGQFLDHVIPVPEALKETMAGSYGDEDKQQALEEQTAENLANHGYSNWYDFCIACWGTKWDVDCQGMVEVSDDGNTVTTNFDSAWSPPTGVYDELVEQGYDVQAYYYEPGMAFVGEWNNGDDYHYELDCETSETVRNTIGDELDDMFGISESMAEWEAENQEEELTEWIKDGIDKLGLVDKELV